MTSKTFCILPWVHAATLTDGTVQLCCVAEGGSGVNLNEQTLADYWNSEYVKDVRLRMLAGRGVRACRRCYREEALGRKSHRLVENEVWHGRAGGEAIERLLSATAPDGTLDAPVQYVDLRLGNTCNLQCVMCQPRESSRWVATARKLSELARDHELAGVWQGKAALDQSRFEWYRNPGFWEQLTTFLPHVREIVIAGGEPFLIREQFDFVRACCEAGEAGHIRLRYHTNGTVFPEELVPFWELFEHVHFFVSIDGVGDVASYVRHPSQWEDIERNIRRFDALGTNTTTNFHFTTHALNAAHVPDVLAWADESGLRNRGAFADLQDYVHTALVYWPAYLDVRVLPAGYKRLVTDRIGEVAGTRLAGQQVDRLTAILTLMNSEDRSDRLPALVEYTALLDRLRGTRVLDTFPDLAPYWEPAGPETARPVAAASPG